MNIILHKWIEQECLELCHFRLTLTPIPGTVPGGSVLCVCIYDPNVDRILLFTIFVHALILDMGRSIPKYWYINTKWRFFKYLEKYASTRIKLLIICILNTVFILNRDGQIGTLWNTTSWSICAEALNQFRNNLLTVTVFCNPLTSGQIMEHWNLIKRGESWEKPCQSGSMRNALLMRCFETIIHVTLSHDMHIFNHVLEKCLVQDGHVCHYTPTLYQYVGIDLRIIKIQKQRPRTCSNSVGGSRKWSIGFAQIWQLQLCFVNRTLCRSILYWAITI